MTNTQLHSNDKSIKQARQEGMSRAADAMIAADNQIEGWSTIAYDFLCRFARNRADTEPHFISEDVSKASKEKAPNGEPYVPEPPTDRAWGSLYARARREGFIDKDGTGTSARRHGSVCIRWRALPQPRA